MSSVKGEFVFKITVIGDGMVGKTSLIKKFTQQSFQSDYIRTIGAQFSKYKINIESDTCTLYFWDIAGQDDFYFLRPSFYQESRAAIIVYSLEENQLGKDSLKHLPNWHNDIKKYCGNIPIILLGNKVDLIDIHTLDSSKVLKMAHKRAFLNHFYTSALTGEGVIEAFHAIINNLYSKYKKISDAIQDINTESKEN
ncbi:MAG: GTP-binding protein [Candidatus Lokiarchaeota archaeon]|nr:GTP-binding protein [Candidatus Lokiarchaeota archaeon]